MMVIFVSKGTVVIPLEIARFISLVLILVSISSALHPPSKIRIKHDKKLTTRLDIYSLPIFLIIAPQKAILDKTSGSNVATSS